MIFNEFCTVDGSIMINTFMQCPKCNNVFDPIKNYGYISKFCSRKCANSRNWSEIDKEKKSISGKNSIKVKQAANEPGLKELKSEQAKQRHKDGILKPPTRDAIKKAVENKKKNNLIRLQQKDNSIKSNYRTSCKFRFNLADYPDEFDFSLIEKFGWYSAPNRGNNINGISRDHKLSISEGWRLNIRPEFISHPANCKLMQHTENWNKRTNSSITEEELSILIDVWDKKYGPLVQLGERLPCK